MAKTFSDLISNRKKAREEEERNKISSSDNGKTTIEGIIEKSSLKKSIGLDTFESDLADMGNKINSIYGEWQTPETMANTRVAVESMQKRVNDYATYQKKYAPDNAFDADSLLKGYQTVLNDWDKLAETYSTFKDAESYKNYLNYLKSLEADQKKKEENVKALDNSFDQYKDYLSKEDYAEKSQYQSTAKREGISGFFGVDTYDETYEFINDENDMRNMLIAKYKEGNGATELEQHGYQYMTDKEKGVYNYKYAVEGKESADQYLKDLEISLNKRVYDESTAKWEKMSDNPLGAVGLSAVSPIMSMAGGIGSAIESFGELKNGEKYNPYAPGRVASNATSDIRGYVGENIAELTEGVEVFGQNPFQQAYGALMSGADSFLMANALGPLGLKEAISPIMAMNSYQQTAKEQTEAGEDPDTVQAMAITSGAIEYITEKIGIDNFFKLKNSDSITSLLKNMGKQAGSEAFEEALSELGNTIAEDVIKGEDSKLYGKYNDLIARGYSKKEALFESAKEFGSNMFWAAAGGALSGGVLGGIDGSIRHNDLKKKGAEIRSNDRVSEMMDVAGDSFMTAKESEAYKLYTEYAKNGVNAENIKDAQLGNLYATAQSEAYDTLNSKKSTPQQKFDAERRVSGLAEVETKKTEAEKSRPDRLKALETGEVTEVKATGNSTSIEGFRTENNETFVQTSEGEFKTSEMTFTTKDAELLSYAEGMGDVKGNLFLSQYDGTANIDDYAKSFNLVHAYGESGFGHQNALALKGVLSERQAFDVYSNAMLNKAAKDQKVLEGVFKDGKVKIDESVIDYTNSGKGEVNWNELTPSQRKSVHVAKVYANALGVDLTFFNTKAENGVYKGKQGAYYGDGVLHVDIQAGRNTVTDHNSYIVPVMSHELTHHLERTSPKAYAKLQDHVMNTLVMHNGGTVHDLIETERSNLAGKRGVDVSEISEELAISELVAKSCEDMLSNSKKAKEFLSEFTESERNTFVGKVKEMYHNLIKWIDNVLKKLDPKTNEAKAFREHKAEFEKLLELWDEALVEMKANQKMVAENTSEQTSGENTFTDNTAQLSMRTYENEGRDLLHKWLEKSDLDEKSKREIIEQMDHVYDVASKYAEDNSLVDFGSWSETDIIRGADGSPLLSVVVPNGDYPLNIDFSQVCKKRKTLNAVLNALVRSGDLDFRSLSQGDINSINRIIKEHGFEIACALCFVDSKRYRVNDWADSFTDTYNKLVKSLTKGTDFVVDEFNYTGRPVKGVEGKLLKDADDSELNFDYINEVLAKNSSGKAIYRYALAIKNNKELRSILRSSEIISSAGLDAIKVENRTLYDLVNSHQGSAKPKLAHGEVPYAYDILLQKKFNAEDAYKVGGVRMQSFSDYMANMFFDYVQMIGDLAAKQLPAHAYTKEYYFAKLFGLTGIKINLSVVPKGADITEEQKARFNKMTKAAKDKDPEFKKLKSHAGLDANGNYILEDETFPLDKALEIQNTEGYDKNCGIIWVGVSNKHIEKMLDDPNVPYIIPYHKSSLNPLIARMRNIDFYNDYTKAQNTRYDTKAKKKVPASIWSFDFYGDLAKTNDPRTTAENYKRECRERGYLPKFDDFASHPNYYKLLIDFRVYDNAGNYAPQGAVQMKFPDNFNEIVGESLREAQDTSARLDASMEGLLSDIRKELKIEQVQHSDRDSEHYHYDNDDVVVIDTKMFSKSKVKNNYKEVNSLVKDMLHELVGKRVEIRSDKRIVLFDAKTAKEYTGSVSTYSASVNEKTTKSNMAIALEKIVERANNPKWIENKKPKHNTDAGRGWTYYDLLFGIRDNDEDIYYSARLVVRMDVNGKDYVYDVDHITKKEARHSENFSDARPASNNSLPFSDNNVKYSDRDSDGNTLTSEQMEYFKDSKVRDDDGNLKVMYHGTYEEFDVFKSNEYLDEKNGITRIKGYFSENEEYAENYGYTKPYYLNVVNPLYLETPEDATIEGWKKWFANHGVKGVEFDSSVTGKNGSRDTLKGGYYNGKLMFTMVDLFDSQNVWYGDGNLTEKIEEAGYDGITWYEEGIAWMPFSANQIKLTTNTNPTEDADIRYSDRYEDAFFDLFDSDGTFAESSAIIEEDVDRLKQRLSMGASSMSAENIKMIAKHLLQKADSRYDFGELTDDIKNIFEYIRTSKNLDSNALIAMCNDVASRILSNQNDAKVSHDYAKMVLREIRSERISTTDEQLEGIKDRYGDKYNNAIIGRIPRSNNGVSLDSKWAEWSQKYPKIFDANIQSKDMLTELDDIVKAMQSASEAKHAFEERVDTIALGAEIYNQMWLRSTTDAKTDADKQKLKELNFAHRKAIDNVRSNLANRQTDAMKMVQIINNMKQKNKADVKKAKELGQKRMREYKENVQKNELVNRISKKSMKLHDKLITNSKEKHIAEPLKKVVGNLLLSIDYSSKQMLGMKKGPKAGTPTQKDLRFDRALREVERMMTSTNRAVSDIESNDTYYGTVFPETLRDSVISLAAHVELLVPQSGEFVLNQMSIEELKLLNTLVDVLSTTVSQVDKVISGDAKERISTLAKNDIKYHEELGTAKAYDGLKGVAHRSLVWRNILPQFAFKRYGKGAQKIFKAFVDGWGKMAFHAKEILDFTDELHKKYGIDKWKKDVHEFKLTNGRQIEMSVPQMMSLYCLSKREQARRHMFNEGGYNGKGIRIADLKNGKKVVRQVKETVLTQKDVDSITAKLTKDQKAVADEIQKFMQTICSEWGNETSMKLYGIKMMGEEFYFPIKTDSNDRPSEPKDNEKSIFQLINKSFTKAINENATDPIVIEDIFDVFAQHSSDMAKYNALAIPIFDAFRWYSYKGEIDGTTVRMKTSLENAFGKDGKMYIYTFLQDLNGTERTGRVEMVKKFFTNSKVSSVGANLRVAALQPFSYARAGLVINPVYLTKALTHKPKVSHSKEYCGIAMWKSLGYYDTNIQRGLADQIKHDQTKKESTTEKSMLLAGKMDELTIGWLWNACELEIRDKRKDLRVGTDEFFKVVGDRLSDVIYSTQVVDSTMTRSEFMRSGEGMDLAMTAFMSEPTVSYNILADALSEWDLTFRQTGSKEEAFKKNGTYLFRAFGTYVISGLITSLVEAGIDVWRDTEEDEGKKVKYWEAFWQNLIDNANPLGLIPYIKELAFVPIIGLRIAYNRLNLPKENVFAKSLEKYTVYGSSRTETQWIDYMINATNSLEKLLNGSDKTKGYTFVKNILKMISNMSGLPIFNAWREITTITHKTGIWTMDEIEEMFDETVGDFLRGK